MSGKDSDSDGKGWCFFEYVIGAVVFVLVVVAVPYFIGALGHLPDTCACQSFLRYISGEDSDSDGKGWCFFEYVFGAVVFVLVVVAVPYFIGPVALTPTRVAALSIAAYVQSVFYGAVVGPGSLFAFLQSAGVVGLGWLSKLFLGSTFGWLATYLPNMVYRLLYGEQE